MRWENRKLGDLCFIGRGSSPRPIDNPAYFTGGTIPWIKIADATSSVRYIFETKDYVNDYGASFSRKLQPGSLILAASGTLGFPMFLGIEGCIHDGWLYFDKLDGIDKFFLYYKLISLREYFNGRAYGAAIQNINTGILKEVNLDIPPLPTQRKIAGILSAYDDLIENNLKRIKLLEEKAFLRYKKIVTNHELKEFSIEDLADVVMGQSPSSETYTTEKDNNLPFHQGVTNFTNYFIEHKTYCRAPVKIAQAGDILFSVRAPVGRINFTSDTICIGRGLCAFRSKTGCQNYLYHQLKEYFFEDDVVGNGAIFNAVTKSELMQIKLKTPCETVQKDFELNAQRVYDLILNLTKQNSKLREARDILLPKLMSGQIEV